MSEAFRKFAHAASHLTGSVYAFALALLIVLVWGATGPLFNFSDTWQLVINTGTTVVTFLMVFLIQNTQNRDSQALHAKLDELVIHLHGARNKLVAAEDLSDEDLQKLKESFLIQAEAIDNTERSRSRRRAQTSANGRQSKANKAQRGG